MLPGYARERVIALTAPASGLAAGAVVECSLLETRTLIAAGQVRPDRNDFRVTYQGTEIDRVMLTTGKFAFRLQSTLAPLASSTDYAISYDSPSETTSPKENPRNVYPAYYDGSDVGSITVTGGSVTTPNIPRPGFLKVGSTAHLKRQAGALSATCLREVELFWDGSYYWASYDGYRSPTSSDAVNAAGLARSTDLLTWEHRTPFGGSRNDPIIHQVPGLSGYLLTYFTVSGGYMGPVPAPPYILHFATGPTVEGPWTYQSTLPLGPSYTDPDNNYNVDGYVFSLDGGTTYYLVYGAYGVADPYSEEPGPGFSICYAKSSSPTGPWTKLGRLGAGNGNYENPRLLNDIANSRSYLLGNFVGHGRGEYYCRSNVLTWNSSAWGEGQTFTGRKLSVIEPGDPGAWDDFAIGVLSMPVIKDGMIYIGYDASNYAEVTSKPASVWRTHMYRDAGFAEARYPFQWAPGILIPPTVTATTPTVLAAGADGDVRIRTDANNVTLTGGAESISVRQPDGDMYGLASFQIWINGVLTTPLDDSIDCNNDDAGSRRTQTILFRRRSGVLTVYVQNIPLWQGASSAALSLSAQGGLVEEISSTGIPYQAQDTQYRSTSADAFIIEHPYVLPRNPRSGFVAGPWDPVDSFLVSTPRTAQGTAVIKAIDIPRTAFGSAYLKSTELRHASGDAVVRSSDVRTAEGTAHVKDVVYRDAAADAVVQTTFSREAYGNAQVDLPYRPVTYADAVVQATQERTAEGTAHVQGPSVRTAEGDAYVQGLGTRAAYGDAVVQYRDARNASGDAVVRESFAPFARGDAMLQITSAQFATASAVVKALGLFRSADGDAVVRATQQHGVFADAVVQQTFSPAATGTAVVQDTIPKNATGTAVIKSTQTPVAYGDAVVTSPFTVTAGNHVVITDAGGTRTVAVTAPANSLIVIGAASYYDGSAAGIASGWQVPTATGLTFVRATQESVANRDDQTDFFVAQVGSGGFSGNVSSSIGWAGGALHAWVISGHLPGQSYSSPYNVSQNDWTCSDVCTAGSILLGIWNTENVTLYSSTAGAGTTQDWSGNDTQTVSFGFGHLTNKTVAGSNAVHFTGVPSNGGYAQIAVLEIKPAPAPALKVAYGTAMVRATFSPIASGDAYVKQQGDARTAEGDAVVQASDARSATGDAVVGIHLTPSASGDAVVGVTCTPTAEGDAYVDTEGSRVTQGDAVVQASDARTAQGSAVVQASDARSAQGSAVVRSTLTRDATADAVVRSTLAPTAEGDAYVQGPVARTAQGDAVVQTGADRTAHGTAVITVLPERPRIRIQVGHIPLARVTALDIGRMVISPYPTQVLKLEEDT